MTVGPEYVQHYVSILAQNKTVESKRTAGNTDVTQHGNGLWQRKPVAVY